jgi:hypothetical protein
MTTKLESLGLTPAELWGIPKPQFATIKPVNIGGRSSARYTGQVDIFPEREGDLKPARDKASEAVLRAGLAKFPRIPKTTITDVTEAPVKNEKSATERVWELRSLDEQQRVKRARKGADEVDSLLSPIVREQEYLRRKEDYKKRKAEALQADKLKKDSQIEQELEKYVKLQVPVKITYGSMRKVVTGIMIDSKNIEITYSWGKWRDYVGALDQNGRPIPTGTRVTSVEPAIVRLDQASAGS